LSLGVAPEHARLVLPVSTYSTMYATCNLRSLWAFLKLRQAETAQWEILQYANALASLVDPLFPVAMRLWREKNDQEDTKA
jgi:thymidylate synthase (FAD)